VSDLPNLEQILRALYGALGEDLSFRECLAAVAKPLKSHLSGLHREELSARRAHLEIIGDAPQGEVETLASEYGHRWAGENPWIVRGAASLVSRGFGDGEEVVAEKDLFQSEYYRHYLKALDIRYGLGMCLWHNGSGNIAVASLNRSADAGPFSQTEIHLIRELQPHMANAYRICRQATRLRTAAWSLRAAIDRAPFGMMLIASSGRVFETNSEAETILAAGIGLARNSSGELVMANQPGLRRLLQDISHGVGGVLNKTLIVTRPTHLIADGLIMHLCALPAIAGFEDGRVVAFLCPIRRSAHEQLDMLILQSALGLTPAEAKFLLALRITFDLHTAASSRQIASSTARTHLKHAFEKTSTHKQAELLSLVDRLLN
jgi:hypothetical protein